MTATGPAAVIVLAAGEGKRMKSSTPKTLHQVRGRTMLGYVLRTASELDPGQLIVVVGHGAEAVIAEVRAQVPDAAIVVQEYLGGTGHAVRIALETVGTITGTIVVTYADTPLLRGATLAGLVAERARTGAGAIILTAVIPGATGYGHILRDAAGAFAGIVEHADATPEQRAIDEVNSGMYAFDGDLLADAIKRVRADNAQGEEYLTDAVTLLAAEGHQVGSVSCPDLDEVRGVNDLVQLAQVRRVMNSRLLESALRTGVQIADPDTTLLDVSVSIAPGAHIGPGTQIEGDSTVGAGARIGPGCLLRDTAVGEGATVISSRCESAVIGAGAVVGPFAYLPPGALIGPGERFQAGRADQAAGPASEG